MVKNMESLEKKRKIFILNIASNCGSIQIYTSNIIITE